MASLTTTTTTTTTTTASNWTTAGNNNNNNNNNNGGNNINKDDNVQAVIDIGDGFFIKESPLSESEITTLHNHVDAAFNSPTEIVGGSGFRIVQWTNNSMYKDVIISRLNETMLNNELTGLGSKPTPPLFFIHLLERYWPKLFQNREFVLGWIQALEIPAGETLTPHTDPPKAGDLIITININKSQLTLQSNQGSRTKSERKQTFELPPYSSYSLENGSLLYAKHSIKNMLNTPRYSITYRLFKTKLCKLLFRKSNFTDYKWEDIAPKTKGVALWTNKDHTASSTYASVYNIVVVDRRKDVQQQYSCEYLQTYTHGYQYDESVHRHNILVATDECLDLPRPLEGKIVSNHLLYSHSLHVELPKIKISDETWFYTKIDTLSNAIIGIAYLLNTLGESKTAARIDTYYKDHVYTKIIFPKYYWFELRNIEIQNKAKISKARDIMDKIKYGKDMESNNMVYILVYNRLNKICCADAPRCKRNDQDVTNGNIVVGFEQHQIAGFDFRQYRQIPGKFTRYGTGDITKIDIAYIDDAGTSDEWRRNLELLTNPHREDIYVNMSIGVVNCNSIIKFHQAKFIKEEVYSEYCKMFTDEANEAYANKGSSMVNTKRKCRKRKSVGKPLSVEQI